MADAPQLFGINIGDIATWFAAIGSIAAAWAAKNAARDAIWIATQQRKNAKEDRVTRARTIAPAIGYELRRAAEELIDIANLANQCASIHKGPGDLKQAFHPGILQRTHAISVFDSQLEVFEGEDGAILAAACAGVLNIQAQVGAWAKRVGPHVSMSWNEGERIGLRLLDAEARRVIERIQIAAPILEKNGGGPTSWEVTPVR